MNNVIENLHDVESAVTIILQNMNAVNAVQRDEKQRVAYIDAVRALEDVIDSMWFNAGIDPASGKPLYSDDHWDL